MPRFDPLSPLLLGLIALYRRFLSPIMGQNCRFTPTCSCYARESIQKHGPFRGLALAIWRILRCAPWGGPGGQDPVP